MAPQSALMVCLRGKLAVVDAIDLFDSGGPVVILQSVSG